MKEKKEIGGRRKKKKEEETRGSRSWQALRWKEATRLRGERKERVDDYFLSMRETEILSKEKT